MGKYDDLFEVAPVAVAPGTQIPQPSIDQASERLAQEKSAGVGKYADLFEGEDVPKPVPVSPAEDPANIARSLEGAATAKQAMGLLLQPLSENWQQESPAPEPQNLRERMLAELRAQPAPTSALDTLKQNIAGLPQAARDVNELTDVPLIPTITEKQAKESLGVFRPYVNENIAGGAIKGLADITSGLTTPKNAILVASLAGAPALMAKLVGLGFAPGIAKSVYEESKTFADETDPTKKAAAATRALGNAALLGGIGLGLRGEPEVAPKIETEAIRAKLGQSETRLPVPDEFPSETPSVKAMPSRQPGEGSQQVQKNVSQPIPSQSEPPLSESRPVGPQRSVSEETVSPQPDITSTAGKKANVPVMITRQMEADLRARGVTEEQLYRMTPAEAHEILQQPIGEPANARPITSTTRAAQPEVRPRVGQETPLRQQRETAGTQTSGADVPGETQETQAQVEPVGITETLAELSRRGGRAPELPTPVNKIEVPLSDIFGSDEPQVTSIKNEVTAAEREARGIAPAIEEARRSFGTVWDEARTKLAADPEAGSRLVESLKAKPRALSDHEDALLLNRQIEVQNEHDAAIKAVNDNPGDAEAQARLERARDSVQDVYDAAKSSGRETGRGLNARKLLAANDFSLAKMEAETRAVVNKGEPLSPKQNADVQALHERIATAEAKVAAFEARDQFNAELKAAKAAKTESRSFLEQQADKARQRIVARRGRLHAGIDPTALVDEAIIGASHIAKGVTKFADWSARMLEEFGERIRPHLEALFSRAKAMHAEAQPGRVLTEEQRLAGAKKRTTLQTEMIRRKIEAGDISKPVRRGPIRPDRELLELRGQLQREKDTYGTMLEKGRRANMSFGQKAAELFVRGERAMKLTGIHTLGKLGGAGITRMVTTPLEQGIGAILNKVPILRTIAKAAPREGFGSLRAEAGALTTGLARGVRDIPRILRGQRTNMESLYGKQNFRYESGSLLDVPGRVHGAMKAPFKEAERERSTILRQKAAERQGLDPTEAATEQEIGQAAQLDAQRSIFMQDNILSDVFRGGIRMLENSKKFPTAGFYLSKLANFLLPIVKVPTNVAIETGTYLGGTASGTGKLIGVMSRGLKNIKPEEADMILRHYKKGAIGAALFFTGYFNSDKFGGYYVEHDKRDPKDVRWGGARIMGTDIPAWLLHAPALLVLQAGATFYRVQHATSKGEEKGKKAAALATAKGVADDIPFIREMGTIDSLLADGYEGNRQRGSLLSSSVVPQGIRDIASMTDAKDAQGNPVRRAPQNEVDYLKMGIPGLRKEVPLYDAMKHRSKSEIRRRLLLQPISG